MKHLQKFENYGKKDRSDLYSIETWIKSVWERIENYSEEEIENFFKRIESMFGEDVATIIDQKYSADKLHYYQTGSTSLTGGIDTGEFINDFSEIKEAIDMLFH